MSAALVADLAQVWSLRGQVVPLEHKVDLLFHDVHKLAPEEREAGDSFLLPLGATAKMTWLLSALELDCRFWRLRWREIPLVQEVHAQIRQSKKYQGAQRKVRKHPDRLVAIKVRDRVILATNDSRGPALAMRPGSEKEVLSWFIAEAGKDLKGLEETEPSGERKRGGGRVASSSAEGPSEERACAQAALEAIKAHENCSQAAYLPSNFSFEVQQHNKKRRRFSVAGLEKKRKVALQTLESDLPGEDRWAEVRAAFEGCVGKALEFLDEGREDAPAPAPALADASEDALLPLLDE